MGHFCRCHFLVGHYVPGLITKCAIIFLWIQNMVGHKQLGLVQDERGHAVPVGIKPSAISSQCLTFSMTFLGTFLHNGYFTIRSDISLRAMTSPGQEVAPQQQQIRFLQFPLDYLNCLVWSFPSDPHSSLSSHTKWEWGEALISCFTIINICPQIDRKKGDHRGVLYVGTAEKASHPGNCSDNCDSSNPTGRAK